MSCNSDVAKTDFPLLRPGFVVILLSISKKIPGIKHKTNYTIPTLYIGSIQNGAKVTWHWRQQVNIECHGTVLFSVNFEIMTWSIEK